MLFVLKVQWHWH